MKQGAILTLKGIMIGIGKIIPGVSGSLLAIILNVYEECLDRISNLFKNLKDNIYYLGCLGIGILISIILGSRILIYLLNNHYFNTMALILGLILGLLPGLFHKTKIQKKKDIIIFLFPAILIYLLETLNISKNNTIHPSYIMVVVIGFLEALTTIIPGISGTATFMILGLYDFVLELFSNPFTIYLPFFILGLVIGIFLISRIITYLLKKYPNEIYLIILSLTISSLFVLLKKTLMIKYTIFNFLVASFLFLLGSIFSYKLNK